MTLRTPKLVSEVPRGYVEVNPEDALKAEIKRKDIVIVETRRGSIEAEARVTDQVQPGLLFVPIHFPNSGANVLTNAALDPVCKCAETKVCAARIRSKR